MALTAEEQMHNAEVREWARANGWPDLGDRGAIPAAVRAAHDAFTGAATGADDGAADFGGAAAAMGLELAAGSPLDSDEDTPDPDGGGTQPPPVRPPAAEDDTGGGAPVTSLAEARERVGAAKAAPGWARPPGGGAGREPSKAGQGKGRRRTRATPAPPPAAAPVVVDQATLDDMAGKLAMILMTPAKAWAKVDPVCGGAALDLGPDIIDKWVPVMARSQAVVKLFTIDALFFQLFAAITATWPLAEAVYDHHFSEQARQRKDLEARQQAQAQAEEDLTMYPSAPPVPQGRGHVPAYQPPQAQM